MSIRTAPAPLPVALIGGYLGAGKTTLVNHLLRQAEGRRIAVLVNDFGSIDIDAELIAGQASADVLALSGGCLCCSFGDDLLGTIGRLRQRDPAPEHVLIELSGVALPAPVRRTLGLATGIEVVGTLVLADAAEIRRQAADRYVGDTVRQQLAEADWLLLNKPDLVTPDELRRGADALATLAPQARLWAGAATALPPELVLGWRGSAGPSRGEGEDAVQAWAGRALAASAAALFDSRSWPLPVGVDLQALGRALAATDSGVLRAKALAADDGGNGWLLQLAGTRWAVTPAAPPAAGRRVLIGLRGRWDPARLQSLLQV
jgi:G3E family GTPase